MTLLDFRRYFTSQKLLIQLLVILFLIGSLIASIQIFDDLLTTFVILISITLGIILFLLALYYPKIALFGIIFLVQFSTLLTKVTGIRLILYASYLLPGILLFILFIRFAIKKQIPTLPNSLIVISALVFIMILTLQTFNPIVPSFGMAINDLFSKYLLHISAFFLGIWLINTKKDLNQFLILITISGVIAASYALYQFLIGFPSFEHSWAISGVHEFHGVNVFLGEDRRVLGTLLYSASYGLFSAICAFLILPLLSQSKRRSTRLALIIAIILCLSGSLLSMTRGIWVAIFCSIGVWAFLNWRYLFKIRASKLLLVLVVIMIVVVIASSTEAVRYRFETFRYAYSEQYDARFSNWLSYWLPKISDWHILTGYGLGLVGAGAERYLPLRMLFWGRSGITDNLYVTIFISTGIFGLLAFLFLAWLTLRQSYIYSRKIRDPFIRIIAGSLFLTFILYYVAFMTADHLTDSYPTNLLFWILCALVVKIPSLAQPRSV